MKFALAVLVVLLVQSTQAFSPMHNGIIKMGQQQQQQQLLLLRTSTTSSRQQHKSSSLMVLAASTSSAEEEVAALRAAAAKAREDADRLSRELGRNTAPLSSSSSQSSSRTPTAPKKSMDEIKAMLPALLAESDVNKQMQQWQALKTSQSITKFGQANLASFPVSLVMLEQRTSLTPETLGLDDRNVDLDEFKYATLYVLGGSTVAGIASLALLPENVGATLCYFFALIPILFIGIGSTSPVIIANAIAAIKGDNNGNKVGKDGSVNVSLQERICRHEAAHFCCGYWCGLPVTSQYSVQENVARVEFGCVPEPGTRGLSQKQVAGLAVTALAGAVGEALRWKNGAQVGSAKNDLLQLENVFRQSSEFIGAVQQQDLTRWGALTAAMLLKNNRDSYEKVVQAFARQASIEECIAILES